MFARGGDGLSSIIFNLATEPFIPTRNDLQTPDSRSFETTLKATPYLDNASLIGSSPRQLQPNLDAMLVVAAKLGLRLNGNKFSLLSLAKGVASSAEPLFIHGLSYVASKRVSMRTTLRSQWAPDLPTTLRRISLRS